MGTCSDLDDRREMLDLYGETGPSRHEIQNSKCSSSRYGRHQRHAGLGVVSIIYLLDGIAQAATKHSVKLDHQRCSKIHDALLITSTVVLVSAVALLIIGTVLVNPILLGVGGGLLLIGVAGAIYGYKKHTKLPANVIHSENIDQSLITKNGISTEGTLKKDREYVYLEVDKKYQDVFLDKIKVKEPNAKIPQSNIGPHISIIRHFEWKGTPPQNVTEVANKYLFKPERIDTVETKNKKRSWVLVVKPSPEILAIRKKYKLSEKPNNLDYHITLAEYTPPEPPSKTKKKTLILEDLKNGGAIGVLGFQQKHPEYKSTLEFKELIACFEELVNEGKLEAHRLPNQPKKNTYSLKGIVPNNQVANYIPLDPKAKKKEIILEDLRHANGRAVAITDFQQRHPEYKSTLEFKELIACFEELVNEGKLEAHRLPNQPKLTTYSSLKIAIG